MKKGRHRRYEEARALKRGSDLDIDSIFSDLSGEQTGAVEDGDDDADDDEYTDEYAEDSSRRD